LDSFIPQGRARIEAAHREVRKSSFAESDRLFHDDIQTALTLVRSGKLITAAENEVGPLN